MFDQKYRMNLHFTVNKRSHFEKKTKWFFTIDEK